MTSSFIQGVRKIQHEEAQKIADRIEALWEATVHDTQARRCVDEGVEAISTILELLEYVTPKND